MLRTIRQQDATARRKEQDDALRAAAAAAAAPAAVAVVSASLTECAVCHVLVAAHTALHQGRAYCATHKCSVCDTPLSSPVTVSGLSYCTAHAHSSSSRSEQVAAKTIGGDKDSAASFRAMKQLLSLLGNACSKGEMSDVDVQGVVSVVSMCRYSELQQKELRQMVADFHQPSEGLCLSLDKVAGQIKLIESFAERIGLLPTQLTWIKGYLHNAVAGLQEADPDAGGTGSAVIEELRVLAAAFADSFLLVTPSFEDKSRVRH
jgi:hypothetical protein